MPELTVATYNTHLERDGRDPALEALLQESYSLSCLQEVSIRRAARLKYAFGSKSFVAVARHGLQYLAIVLPEDARFLSRRTVQFNGHLGILPAAWSARLGYALYRADLPGWADALEPRVAQVARVSWRGFEFQVVNTHMPLGRDLRNKSLTRLLRALQDANMILAGDFNATPQDLFLRDLLLAGGLSLAGSRKATHNSGRRIDYVMFGDGFREVGYSLEKGLSDHRLVRTVLEV